MQTIVPVTVVIPTMNRPESLRRTLRALFSSSALPSEVIVVDQSASEGPTARVLEDLRPSLIDRVDLRLLYRVPPSLTSARNTGLECSTNDIVVFSDDDVDVFDDTILNVEVIMRDRTVALIAGVDSNTTGGGNRLGYIFWRKSYCRRKEGHVTLSILGRLPHPVVGTVATDWAMGYFFAIRRSLALGWNLQWDELLTGYGYAEDLDFSVRYARSAYQAGLHCILTDQVVVSHLVSPDWRITTYRLTAMLVMNREYLSYKLFPHRHLSRFATRWANFGEFLRRAITRQAPFDVIKAQIRCDQVRPELRRLELHESHYCKATS